MLINWFIFSLIKDYFSQGAQRTQKSGEKSTESCDKRHATAQTGRRSLMLYQEANAFQLCDSDGSLRPEGTPLSGIQDAREVFFGGFVSGLKS